MTIKELKEQIADLPDDMILVVQKDSEGNGYSPLSGIDPDSFYVPDSTYSGQVYPEVWSPSDCDMDIFQWLDMRSQPKVVVLFPIN